MLWFVPVGVILGTLAIMVGAMLEALCWRIWQWRRVSIYGKED